MRSHVVQVFMCWSLLLIVDNPARPQAAGGRISENAAFGLVRTVNTSEATIFSETHRYVAFEGLVQHNAFRELRDGLDVRVGDASSGTVKDYTLSVLVSVDGKHYAVELRPTEQGCQPALFSSEAAVIYMGNAFGCGEATFPVASSPLFKLMKPGSLLVQAALPVVVYP